MSCAIHKLNCRKLNTAYQALMNAALYYATR